MNLTTVWLAALGVIVCICLTAMARALYRQQRLNQDLHNQLREQQAFLEPAATGMLLIADGTIRRCNRALETLLGYAADELTGQSGRVLHMSEATHAEFEAAAQDAIASGRHWEVEWQLQKKDGSTIWCTCHAQAWATDETERGLIWTLHDISECKKIASALQQVQQEQAIFDHALVGIEYIRERVILRCNRGWEQILGYAPGELKGKSTRIYYPSEESWVTHGKIAYAMMANKQKAVHEWEFMRKDGSRIWCSSHSKAIDENDLKQGSIWVYQDISEQKAAEAALTQALMEQQAIFDNAIAGIAFVKDNLLLRCNHGLETMFGYTDGELPGQAVWVLFQSDRHWLDYQLHARQIQTQAESAVPEWEFRRKDGAVIWCSLHAKALSQEDPGKGWIWVFQDISSRKFSELALHRAILEQQAVFDNIRTCIVIVRKRQVVRLNRCMEDLLEFNHDELIGQSTRIYFPSDAAHEEFNARVGPVIRRGDTAVGECEVRGKHGKLSWVLYQGRAINPEDLSQGVVFAAQDITERKRNETALIESKQVLEHSLAELERTQREVSLLAELSSFLQACQSGAEAYAGIAEYGAQLFPDSSGALYLMDESHELLQRMLNWGPGAQQAVQQFLISECWALRRGQQYRLDQPSEFLCCPHLRVHHQTCQPYACLPLVAQGKTFGLFYLEHGAQEQNKQADVRHKLGVAFAEQVGLAFANLRLRDALRQQSIRDPLTGLFNRRYMQDTLTRELSKAKRQRSLLAVAMLDVDHFKKFNDHFGHDAGDLVLQNVASVLQGMVRESDIVCRYGGEEFIVLLPEISERQAIAKAQQLIDAIRKIELRHGTRELGKITSSLGLALFPQHGGNPDDLISAADNALYQAKERGRDQVVRCA